MALPYNPLTWKAFDLTQRPNMQVFLNQLSEDINQLQLTLQSISANFGVPGYYAGLLNGTGDLNASSLTVKNMSLGSVGTNQAVDCTGATAVAINLTLTSALTLSLNNLGNSVEVFVRAANSTGSPIVMKINGTNSSAVAFTNVFAIGAGGSESNLQTTGTSVTNGGAVYLQGTAIAGTSIFMMAL